DGPEGDFEHAAKRAAATQRTGAARCRMPIDVQAAYSSDIAATHSFQTSGDFWIAAAITDLKCPFRVRKRSGTFPGPQLNMRCRSQTGIRWPIPNIRPTMS